ncbi:MAG: hypothetical protein COA29_02655 [Porticoccus sp.]|jgi:O-antigen ligase|nr:MAG: hypothetical protein COA29_02655 [Porticoccus sp.]
MIATLPFEEKTKTLFFYSVVFLLASIFFIPEKNLHLKLFILFVCIAFPLIVIKGLCKWSALLESRTAIASFLFLGYSLLSLLWSEPESSRDILNPIKDIFYLVSFWVIFLFTFNGEDRRLQCLVKWLIIVGSTTAACYAAYHYLYLDYPLTRRFTIPGPLVDKVRTGFCLGAGALLCLGSLLYEPGNRERKPTILLLLALTIFLVTLVLTHTRWAIAGTLFFGFVMVALSPTKKRTKLLIIGLGLMLLIAACLLLTPLIDIYIEKGQSSRFHLWSGYLKEFHHYWFGHGLGTTIYIAEGGLAGWHAYHSVYLGALLSGGFVGLTLLLLMILTVLLTGWKLRANPYAVVATILFAFACTMGLLNLDSVISKPRGYWLIFWLPLIVISRYELNSLPRKAFV